MGIGDWGLGLGIVRSLLLIDFKYNWITFKYIIINYINIELNILLE